MTPAQTRLWPHMTGSRVWPRKIPDGPVVKTSPFSAGNEGLIPGLERSSGEGHGNPLQYSCLENPTERGIWQTTVHSVAKSQT